MKTLDQLKENARKEFDKKLYHLVPNKKQIKNNEGAIIYPDDIKLIKAFLDTQIDIAYEEGRKGAWKIAGESLDQKDILIMRTKRRAYQTAIEDALSKVPKKDDTNYGHIGNNPDGIYSLGMKEGRNNTVDTITNELKKLKVIK
jgi:hypothetical protein